MGIDIVGLRHVYGNTVAVHGLDLRIEDGEFLTLLGPSGSGKTTTLMMLAGFLYPSAGEIRVDGTDISSVPPQKRGIGMVFQNYALFPHLTVRENVRYPLRMRGVDKTEGARRANEALELVGLAGYGDRRIHQLSGGQQQRVALARAVVFKSRLLLMDEPLGALDKKLRQEMQVEIKRLQQRLGVTIVYVTHDQEEALSMSDRIAVMNDGRLAQVGTPAEIYDRPRTAFVADFLGDTNLITGTFTALDGENLVIQTKAGQRFLVGNDAETIVPKTGHPATFSIRPERISFTSPSARDNGGWNSVAGLVRSATYLGDAIKIVVETELGEFLVKRTAHDGGILPGVGERVTAGWQASSTHLVEEAR